VIYASSGEEVGELSLAHEIDLPKASSGDLILGEVSIKDLAITRVLSMNPEDYSVKAKHAIAAKNLEKLGVDVEPGQAVTYLITRSGASAIQSVSEQIYDVEAYLKILRNAAKTVLEPMLEHGYRLKQNIFRSRSAFRERLEV